MVFDVEPSNVKQVTATKLDGSSPAVQYVDTPDLCPICRQGIFPRLVGAALRGTVNTTDSSLRIVFQCTRIQCQETFLGYYEPITATRMGLVYVLEKVAPMMPAEMTFSESITELSPAFIKIFNQAAAAEAAGLDEITGIGLRKALEFLLKDFLIKQEPGKVEEIKSKLLGACINEHVSDPNIKATAKLATWLGNDETHYVRKWEDRDIKDLKILIRLTVNWIDNVLLTQKYAAEMNP